MAPSKIPQPLKDLSLLREPFRSAALKVVADIAAADLPIVICETLRSTQRQGLLAGRGVSLLKVGPHCYGLAMDPILDPYAKQWTKLGGRPFRSIDGGGASWDTGYDIDGQGELVHARPHVTAVAMKLGDIAAKHGLEWGGKWTGRGPAVQFPGYPLGWDPFHLQMPDWSREAKRRAYVAYSEPSSPPSSTPPAAA